jgi:hypothetical protein
MQPTAEQETLPNSTVNPTCTALQALLIIGTRTLTNFSRLSKEICDTTWILAQQEARTYNIACSSSKNVHTISITLHSTHVII